MRLIDSEMIKIPTSMVHSINGCLMIRVEDVQRIVSDQPTAFDKEKVMGDLQEELKLSDTEKERCARENPLQFDSVKGYANGIANAIEIVEKGGIE